MEMVDFSVRVPKDMIPYLTTHGQEQDFERNALMLYGLIKSGRMSHGRAAEILGVRINLELLSRPNHLSGKREDYPM